MAEVIDISFHACAASATHQDTCQESPRFSLLFGTLSSLELKSKPETLSLKVIVIDNTVPFSSDPHIATSHLPLVSNLFKLSSRLHSVKKICARAHPTPLSSRGRTSVCHSPKTNKKQASQSNSAGQVRYKRTYPSTHISTSPPETKAESGQQATAQALLFPPMANPGS